MRTTQSPCAADALFGTRAITVAGRTIGIARICDAIAAVQAMYLSGNEELKAALLREVGERNYIPESLRDAYGDALMEEYRAARKTSSDDEQRQDAVRPAGR